MQAVLKFRQRFVRVIFAVCLLWAIGNSAIVLMYERYEFQPLALVAGLWIVTAGLLGLVQYQQNPELFLRFFAMTRSRKSEAGDSSLRVAEDTFDLEKPLLQFSPQDSWRIRDACEGTQIFGATGSGKTSGSGQAIAKAFLTNAFGGVVVTAKKDERSLWERYAEETGRTEDLIIFSPERPWRFNFMDYELKRPGQGAGLTENLVALFSTVLEIAERKQRGLGGGDPFWKRTVEQILRNAVDLLVTAKGTISLPELNAIISSAPQNIEQTHDEAWQKKSFCFECITQGEEKKKGRIQEYDFVHSTKYWLREFPLINDKTRSGIVSSFTSMADRFLRGILRELFCTKLTLVPEMTLEGKIIILDLPIKEFGEVGQYAQVLFKFLWQKSTERREVTKNSRPVFLWADESQFFVTSADSDFQSTARASRACTVYLTQNLPKYQAELGGDSYAESQTHALLGNLQTTIFHANSDTKTNQWASELIGQVPQYRPNVGVGGNGRRQEYQTSMAETMDWQVHPLEFTKLRKGGPAHKLRVNAIVFQGGRVWKTNNHNFLRLQFQQETL